MYTQARIVQCPLCQQVYRIESVLCWLRNNEKIWSDGYNDHDITHEFPFITRCEECYGYFWTCPLSKLFKRDPGIIRLALNQHKAPDGKCFFPVRKLTVEEYVDVLAYKKYTNPEEERYLRMHLWWDINKPYRNGELNGRSEEMTIIFEENLETLINKTPADSPDHLFNLAEMHRELGLFKEAEQYLNQLDDNVFEQKKLKLRQKIESKETHVFLI